MPDQSMSNLSATAAEFRSPANVKGMYQVVSKGSESELEVAPMPEEPKPEVPKVLKTSEERAWCVQEIRQQILAALPNRDLARTMTVSRDCFEDAARELYHELSYDRVNLRLDRTTTRKRVYCDAVRVVDARAMTITPAHLDALGVGRKNANGPRNRAKYLDVYRSDILDLIVPPLREKCRGIRKILLGTGSHNFGPPFWVVQFNSPWPFSSQYDIPDFSWEPDYGHIDYVSTYEFDILDGPPARIKPPPQSPTPSHTYTVRNRFDLVLRACMPPVSLEYAEQWHLAMTDGQISEGLYRGLNVNTLPISLGVLSGIYHKQKALRYHDRLNEIHAYNVQPWDIYDFQRLAMVAATSITKLDISDYPERELQTLPPKTTFADLPQIIWTIRNYMPNLKALRFNLGGIEDAEALCWEMLDECMLAEGGPIKDLYVMTSQYDTPLFNILRCLSSITTPDADIEVDNIKDGGSKVWNAENQMAFCRYIKNQEPTPRAYLSIVDFTSALGITEPLQVLDLTYDKHGRPHRLAEAKAATWSRQIKLGATTAIKSLIPKFQTGLLESIEAACQFRAISADGTKEELLEEAQKLLNAVVATRAAAKAMDVIQTGVEADIRAYVEAIKAGGQPVLK